MGNNIISKKRYAPYKNQYDTITNYIVCLTGTKCKQFSFSFIRYNKFGNPIINPILVQNCIVRFGI